VSAKPDGPLLGGKRIKESLADLGRRCAAAGVAADMFVVGGAAIALAYSEVRATRDIDAVFEPKMRVYEVAK
jgi:methylmalonyl-CoA mutase cobalamin-binding subunit